MNYTPYSSSKKGNSVFYIIIIIALIIIAIVAWIGLSNMNKPKTDENPGSNISDSLENSKNNSQEYTSDDSSYNNSTQNNSSNNSITETPKDNMSDLTPSAPTNDEVKDEPYSKKAYTLPTNGDILKDFSTTALQFSATFGDMRLHPAVDIACKEGSLISALTDGKVLSVEDTADLGKTLTIDHGDGLIVKYAALKDLKLKAGDGVKAGDLIGAVTTVPSECGDQSHLHIEATENGNPISILKFFN